MGKRGGEGQSLRIGGKGEKCCSGNDCFSIVIGEK